MSFGNRSRTGMHKPKGSGKPRELGAGAITSFTIRVSTEERNRWRIRAQTRGQSTSAFIREVLAECLEAYQ